MVMRSLRTKTKSIMLVVVIVFVLSLVTMYIARGTRGNRHSAEGDYVVAKVNGEKVMRSQVDKAIRNMAESMNVEELDPKHIAGMRKSVLNNIAIYQELQKEVKAKNITVDEQEINEAVKRIEKGFTTKEAFMAYMQNNNIKMEDLKKELRERLAQQKLITESTSNVEISEEEVKDFYEKTKDYFFKKPEGYEVIYARFKDEDAARKFRELLSDKVSWDNALSEVKDSLTNSTEAEKPVFVSSSDFAGSLKAFADLKLDEIGGPQKIGENDYLVLIKKKKEPARVLSYDEVKDDIIGILKNEKRQQAEQEYLANLLSRADIQVVDEQYFTPPAEVSSDDAQPSGDNIEGNTEEKTSTDS